MVRFVILFPLNTLSQAKLMRNDYEKSKVFPLNRKKQKENLLFFSVNTKKITSHVLKISAISRVLRTREITDIFNPFDEIYLVFTSKK